MPELFYWRNSPYMLRFGYYKMNLMINLFTFIITQNRNHTYHYLNHHFKLTHTLKYLYNISRVKSLLCDLITTVNFSRNTKKLSYQLIEITYSIKLYKIICLSFFVSVTGKFTVFLKFCIIRCYRSMVIFIFSHKIRG